MKSERDPRQHASGFERRSQRTANTSRSGDLSANVTRLICKVRRGGFVVLCQALIAGRILAFNRARRLLSRHQVGHTSRRPLESGIDQAVRVVDVANRVSAGLRASIDDRVPDPGRPTKRAQSDVLGDSCTHQPCGTTHALAHGWRGRGRRGRRWLLSRCLGLLVGRKQFLVAHRLQRIGGRLSGVGRRNDRLYPALNQPLFLRQSCGYLLTVLQGVGGVGVARVGHGHTPASFLKSTGSAVVSRRSKGRIASSLLVKLLDVADACAGVLRRVIDVPILVSNALERCGDDLHAAHCSSIGGLGVLAAARFLRVDAAGEIGDWARHTFRRQCRSERVFGRLVSSHQLCIAEGRKILHFISPRRRISASRADASGAALGAAFPPFSAAGCLA
ncbi:hypothetical protein D9M72_441700 [compost metagenome]